MSRFNTGNPLGSNDPRDLDDNAKNLDQAVNAEQDTFQDRLGKSRLTWAGIVKAGSGDPAIAVDAAARAEAAASSVEQNAEQIAQDAAQQAVDNVVIAVDGAVDRAEGAADRAEGAADRAETAAESVKPYVDGALSDLSTAANKFYPTLALANADIANIVVNQPIHVGEADNGGLWYKATAGATTLTKSAYDPLTQAKNYADENAIFNPKSVSSTLGVDLNNLNTFGFHKILSHNAWNATLNKPKDLTGPWAFVLVLPVSSTAFFQLFYSLNDKKIAYRVRTSTAVISEWELLSGDEDVLQSILAIVDSQLSPKFEIVGKNLFDPSAVVLGKTITAAGVILENRPNGVLSGVFDVTGQSRLYVSGLQPSAEYRAIVFLKDDGTVAGVLSIAPNLTEKVFYIQQSWGAVKAQMCIKENVDTFTLDTSTIQFEFSEVKTEYEPFKRGPLKSLYGVEISVPTTPPDERFIKSRAFGASYLIFGDSITETSDVDLGIFDQTSRRKNWPTWAAETLQMGVFRNYAKSGAAFKDLSQEWRYQYLHNQVIDAIANNEDPDVIVVACGTNDGLNALGNYESAMLKPTLDDLDQTLTLEAARWVFWKLRLQYPDAVCFYANPLQRMANTTEELAPLVDGLSKMAQRHGFILIDQHRESGIIRELEVLSGSGKYLADGLHPNDEGRKRQADLIVSRIASYMAY